MKNGNYQYNSVVIKNNIMKNSRQSIRFILNITFYAMLLCPVYTLSQTAVEFYNNGLAKGQLKDFSGAIIDYTKAIEINPKFEDAYYNRGKTKILLGLKDSGCLDLSKAGEFGYEKAYDLPKEYCN